MKKTYAKVIVRTVKSTMSRFLAIFAIVAIGVGFLAGLLAATPDMRYTGDKYFDETNLFDLRVISTMGLTDKDVEYFKTYDGIDEVMAAQSADIYLGTPGKSTLVTRVHGIDFNNLNAEDAKNYLNRLVLIEGEWPKNTGECLVEKGTYGGQPVQIGETLTLSDENENIDDVISQKTFKVTGIVQSSYYFSFDREPSSIGSGTTHLFMYADISAFSQKAYSEIYLSLKGAKELNSLDKPYEALRDDISDNLEKASAEPIARRFTEVKTEAAAELADAKAEYADKKAEAEEKLADAAETLLDANIKLADGEKKLFDGENEYTDGMQKLADARIELAKGEQALLDGKNQFNTAYHSAKAELEAGSKQYEQGAAQMPALEAGIAQLEQGIAQLEAALQHDPNNTTLQAQLAAAIQQREALLQQKNQIISAKAQLDNGYAQLDAGKAAAEVEFVKAENQIINGTNEIAEGEKELRDAEIELANARLELEDAKIKLADGQKEYDDAKAEADEKLADGQRQIDDAEKQIAELEMPEWYILGRDTNMGFASFNSNISKVEAIARVFPVFFFLVAALVALTTMTRMVEEERLQIGTVKALGYSKAQIAFKYSIYAFTASALGCAVGLVIGFNLFPRVIWNAYGMMYNLPQLVCQFNVKYALISSLTAILCTMAATANAVWATLAEHPASLMLPRAPMAGKRIFLERIGFIWKRMKFTHKVTARNIFRYKKRFFMTVIGIAGCTGLLVAGFGMRDSVSDIIYNQFGNIFTYDFTATVKNEDSINDKALLKVLENKQNVDAWMRVSEEKSTNKYGDEMFTTYIVVPESVENLPLFYSLHERKSKKEVVLANEGIVITEKLSERTNIKEGDKITMQNADKISGTFLVTGVVENYVENYVYMSAQEYERGFAQKPELTTIMGRLAANDNAREALGEEILKGKEVNTVSFVQDVKKTFDDMLNNITYIVYVLIISSAALAFVVLYNLTNININEREKEIATIKVLGFFDKEVSAYVYRESLMLSVIGTLCGLVLGIFLHMFVIRTAEVDAVMFGREISPLSFLFSAGLTMLFSILVSVVMNIKLKRISMVESMKAPE